ncbi:MAG: hypothetical protein N3A69_10870 [Leptospiraceae bacterium]|nr:hypothetical protein [Leptospiraceae bacterium]
MVYGVEWTKQEIKLTERGIQSIHYAGKYIFPTEDVNQVVFVVHFFDSEIGRESNFELFFIPEELQGRGFSKRILKDYFDYLRKSNVKKVNIFANKDVGGYAWARFGFMANSRAEVEKILLKRGKDLTEKELQEVKRLVEVYYRKRSSSEPFPMKLLAKQSYGKKLLLNSSWYGHADLTDKEQLKTIYKYMKKGK